jgi:UDP-N-acetylmuramate--alanine ligase
MSGIAEVLLKEGYFVSGSDLEGSAVTERLAALGAQVALGHAAAHVAGAHVVVTSSAVRADNPELAEARRAGVPVIPRAEMLAELMRLKHGIAVSGSHGKTTTTSMIAAVLGQAGLDPTVVVGGRLAAYGSGARVGRGEFLVAEADESDRSFLMLSPAVAVITNVDREHLDCYAGLAEVQDAFAAFANKVPFYGAAVVCLDDPPTRELLPRIARPVVGYGLAPGARVSACEVEADAASARYLALADGEPLGRVTLQVGGEHNVLNSLAAVAVGLELELGFDAIREGLASFRGVLRRFERLGEAAGVTLVDDYGHHPTEIRVTLRLLRALAAGRRCVVLFQPHRYTRTRALWDDFCRAFDDADLLLLTDVYAASEEEIPGVSAAALARAIAGRGSRRVLYAGALEEAVAQLAAEVKPGDVVLTLGAGSVAAAGRELLRRLTGAA